MPNITLETLAGIPEVNQEAMEQNNPNACGAYAIVAAVGAFGTFPVNTELTYVNEGPQEVEQNANVEEANTYPELSAVVYQVTGILNNDINEHPVVPELLAAGNVYNSPAAMSQVAIDLGREVQVNVQALGFEQLSALYPDARTRCEIVVGDNNVNVNADAYAAPAEDETHVVCVSHPEGFHWLGRGSDGNFYDPADGSLDNNWNPINVGDQMGDYLFTGLWLLIS